jgi:enoyl-CoA hydratase/carnithine racemase
MRTRSWNHDGDAAAQIAALCAEADEPGILRVDFSPGGDGPPIAWSRLEPWTRSRSVTVAVIAGALAPPAVEVGLCCDLVYVDPASAVRLSAGPEPPPAGALWALGRAGRRALARGLLDPAPVTADELVLLGLAHGLVRPGEALPLPAVMSEAALTSARDLLRTAAGGVGAGALESAAFRLLFAAGDPREGAAAFLEKRHPEF